MSKITASNVHIYPAREQTSCMIFSLTVTNRLGFFIGQRCVLPHQSEFENRRKVSYFIWVGLLPVLWARRTWKRYHNIARVIQVHTMMEFWGAGAEGQKSRSRSPRRVVLSHGAAPSYLCYANDVTGRILRRRGTSLTFLGHAGRKAAAFSNVHVRRYF